MLNFDFMIRAGAATAMTEKQFFELEIKKWKESNLRKKQIVGEKYYRGEQDILSRKRTAIGEGGTLVEVKNLPNNRLVDNQYAKMVDQKANYLLGKPFAFQTENEIYANALKKVFNRRFYRVIKNLGKDSFNGAVGWLYVFYDESGKFSFKRFAPSEVLPFWRDAERTILDCVVRVYEVEAYEGPVSKKIERVEIYKDTGIYRYELINGVLVDDVQNPSSNYVAFTNEKGENVDYNWNRIPIIAFKYNDVEIPLISKVKCLQDALNEIISDFQNNMQEDSRNTILVIRNYGGESLSTFRHNLAAYGAVKVVDGEEGAKGGVDTISVEVNSGNYKILLDILKKSLIENAMGFDAKDDRMSGSPNQMNILSMYSDIDLDANGMETEYQASFEDLRWFIDAHLANSGLGNFEDEDVEFIFNRDMMMNESDIIDNVRKSDGVLSKETLVAHHPWVNDVSLELERLETERKNAVDFYGGAFASSANGNTDDGEGAE